MLRDERDGDRGERIGDMFISPCIIVAVVTILLCLFL